MTTSATILSRVRLLTDEGQELAEPDVQATIANVVGSNGKREEVTLSAAFVALSPPTGATFVRLRWISGTGTWTLKGITSDTGIALGTPSATTAPIHLTLSAASIGILGSAAGVVECFWS